MRFKLSFKPKVDTEWLLRFELFLSAVLLVIDAGTALLFLYASEPIAVYSFIFASLFLIFAFLYTVRERDVKPWNKPSRRALALHALFILMLITYTLIYASDWRLGLGLVLALILTLESFTLFLLLFLPLFLLVFLGALLMRRDWHRERRSKLLLFAIVFMMLIITWFVILHKVFRADDEELLKLTSVGMLLNGTDPYSTSIEPLLYSHTSTIGATITTENTFLGVMDYPSLFFLLFLPFYPFSQPVISNLLGFYMPAQAVVFSFVLLLTFGYLLDKKYLARPALMLLAFSIFAITYISSITAYLLISLLLLAYAKIGSRYAWLFLGLCVSIQEQLWLPVLFLLAYSLNNYGFWKTARNALGMIAVFLIFNGYFIAINPSAYIRAVFLPLNQLITPFNPSPIAFLLISHYPLLLSTYSKLFILVSLLMLCLLMYWNRKELIPLMSLTPFFFLDHILSSYYTLFLFAFLFTFYMKPERRKAGIVERELKNRKPFFALMILALLALMLYVMYSSHAQYERNFNISFTPQSIAVHNSSNTTVSSGVIGYHNLSNSTVYVFAVVQSGFGTALKGLVNQSIISNPQDCANWDYRCLVNVNRLVLPANASTYELKLSLPWQNSSKLISRSTVVLYNGEYFYTSPSISNYSAWYKGNATALNRTR